MSTPTPIYWHALNLCLESGLHKCLDPAHILGGPQALFEANTEEMISGGLSLKMANKIIASRQTIDLEREWNKLTKNGVQTICYEELNYPRLLREIYDPPPLLYVRGKAELLNSLSIAVIGSRRMSSYGRMVVESIVPSLCNLEVSIVSGMALGVDAAALNVCIDCGGSPIGVLASSLVDREISPHSNIALAKKIIQTGCLVSENPPGRPTVKTQFPLRNRIVSGLSKGTVVVEAAIRSGSLITARLALEQSREVFAVPGPIFSSHSAGTLELIKNGAKCITSALDIIQEFGWDMQIKHPKTRFDNPLHQKVYELASTQAFNTDEIISKLNESPDEVLAALTELEMLSILRRSANGLYTKNT
jgi:DNA processing protein